MKPRYCLPIIKETKASVVSFINKHVDSYDYFEVWLDYINDFDMEFIGYLKKSLGARLVILFRRQNLEPIIMDYQDRLKIVDILAGSEVLLDLDIVSQQDELEYIKSKQLNIHLITSYHNYEKTPTDNELNELASQMNIYRPTIYKLATMCKTRSDSLRLLRLLLKLHNEGYKYIVIGMGQAGIITRIAGGLWGNELNFAPQTLASQSAPGQLTKGQLRTIFKELEA